MPETTAAAATTTTPPPQFTSPRLMRDDCWSEEATFTLISAWGRRYLELNRGNLRQKQWQEVADAVNGAHGQVVKNRRTDVQCKNRIDTLKKRYKNEKEMARASAVHGREFVSQWLFFKELDCLLDSSSGGSGSSNGGAFPINFVSNSPSQLQLQSQSQSHSQSPPFALPIRRTHGDSIRMNVIPNPQSQLQSLSPPFALPIRRGNDGNIGGKTVPINLISNSPSFHHSMPFGVPIRCVEGSNGYLSGGYSGGTDGHISGGGNYGGEIGNNGNVNISTPILPQKRPVTDASFNRNYAMVAAAAARKAESEGEEAGAEEEEEEEGKGDGIRELARVIEKFGEVYRRVEKEKQKQLIELEKQRMEFAKEMECQRMQMIVEMQVQLEKMKRARRSNSDDTRS